MAPSVIPVIVQRVGQHLCTNYITQPAIRDEEAETKVIYQILANCWCVLRVNGHQCYPCYREVGRERRDHAQCITCH